MQSGLNDSCFNTDTNPAPVLKRSLVEDESDKESIVFVKRVKSRTASSTVYETDTRTCYVAQTTGSNALPFDTLSKKTNEGKPETRQTQQCLHPDGCVKRARFNFPTEKRAAFCGNHKKDGMVAFVRWCETSGCYRPARYAEAGARFPRFCNKHGQKQHDTPYKKESVPMVSFRRRTCRALGCETYPSYNHTDQRTGAYCATHREEGMIKITTRCRERNCAVGNAKYNWPDQKTGMYCTTHRIEGMVNVHSRRCEQCELQPNYNYPGVKPAVRCAKHKEHGMVDTRHELCVADGCPTRARFGVPGQAPKFCATHRPDRSYVREPRKRCVVCRTSLATCGPADRPLRCEKHAIKGDRNVVEQPCSGCGLDQYLSSTGKCRDCDPETFLRVRLAKQKACFEALTRKNVTPAQIDRVVDDGQCGKERPDGVFYTLDGSGVILLEVDEHQHRERACECEYARMRNLSQMFDGRPVVFVRFNPDAYKPALRRTDESVFDVQRIEIKQRHVELARFIKKLQKKPETFRSYLCSAFYLYYDGWAGFKNAELVPLDRFETQI